MGQEIEGLQDNINQNFAQILADSGLDYRVLILGSHGPLVNESVCIEAPLSGIPFGGCTNPPAAPIENPPVFYHHSVEVASHDSWCRIIQNATQPDAFNLHPDGFLSVLRTDARKHFIEVSDDGVNCGYNGSVYNDANTVMGGIDAAALFDADLLALSPEHFGDDANRKYVWHSLIAMAAIDSMNPATPWLPSDSLTTGECATAADAGTGYQGLSTGTVGLRFSMCDTTVYDLIFTQLAEAMVEDAAEPCRFEVPVEVTMPAAATMEYYAGGVSGPVALAQVADAGACTADAFYIDAGYAYLCPSTCATVEADDAALVNFSYSCG